MNIINKSGGNLGGDDCAYSIDRGGGFRVSRFHGSCTYKMSCFGHQSDLNKGLKPLKPFVCDF